MLSATEPFWYQVLDWRDLNLNSCSVTLDLSLPIKTKPVVINRYVGTWVTLTIDGS